MTGHPKTIPLPNPFYLSVSRYVIQLLATGAVVGIVVSGIAALLYDGGLRRVMLAYLVAFAFALSLSLGALFFVLVQHLMRAGWGVLVRRPAEVFSLNTITVAVLFLPILFTLFVGGGVIYPWAQSGEEVAGRPVAAVTLTAVQHGEGESDVAALGDEDNDHHQGLYVHQTLDALTRAKQGWLNPVAYLARSILFFLIWCGIAWFYFSRSRRQDNVASDDETRKMEWWAGLSMLVFGVTLTYAAFDILMSLDPHWYSTIFGVYYFAGCAVAGLSVTLLSVLLLERIPAFSVSLSDEHRRDLGRLLFAFVCFWGYIAFSQYMLLWYVNVPETARWFVVRGASTAEGFTNSWGYLLLLLLFGHFLIPFFGIISRHVKSSKKAMIFWTAWLLVMHYFDLYWLVMPELGPQLVFGLPELGTLLLVSCVYLLGASLIATRTSLVPVGDPRLSASLAVTDAY